MIERFRGFPADGGLDKLLPARGSSFAVITMPPRGGVAGTVEAADARPAGPWDWLGAFV
jgi:hypothetical protein